ncbi:MAG TPA: hypothetical protein VK204_08675 [Nocardioidaceae bacterium]|nr:hypothetical protein [Nocardioidaceae bacterium]
MAESLAREHVREFVRSAVRSGLLGEQELYDEAVLAITSELPDVPDPRALADEWVAEFRDELRADATSWPEVTDYDRLQAAFADLESNGIVVLQGCEDHWSAKRLLDSRAGDPPAGIAWFTPPDVWHAIDEGMLEVNVWHASTANVAPGDALLDEVVAAFGRQGLSAHFDEGRVEVSAHWQRRSVTGTP